MAHPFRPLSVFYHLLALLTGVGLLLTRCAPNPTGADRSEAQGTPSASLSPSPSPTAAQGDDRDELRRHALPTGASVIDAPDRCGLPEVPTPTDLTKEVRVFFSCYPTEPIPGHRELSVATRLVTVAPGEDPKRVALASLLEGPSQDELAEGVYSFYGSHTQDIEFDIAIIDETLAVVNFHRDILRIQKDNQSIFVANGDVFQIVETLGQFPDIKYVAILIDGQPLCKVQDLC